MTRKKMSRRLDRKIFRRTARSVAAANLNSDCYRGGIRL